MKITNNYNLPTAVYNALSRVYPPKADRYSVTDLINPPQIRALKLKHWDQMEEDASSRLWALLGQGIHAALAGSSPEDALSEESLAVEKNGVKITGRPDLLHEQRIEDFKVTSVYSFLLGEKVEWTSQINIYAWMYREYGFTVDKGYIYAILRDWKEVEKYRITDYPEIPFQSIQVPIWSIEEQEKYIAHRLELHRNQALCTDADRWMKPTTYAVVKKGQKRAQRVLKSHDEAEKWIEQKGPGFEIVERVGDNVRCERFCVVSQVCPQWKQIRLKKCMEVEQ